MKTEFLTKAQAIERIKEHAKYGGKVLEVLAERDKPRTIWAGLGNRAGLHSYADTVMQDTWDKRGERFLKNLEKKAQSGAVFQLADYYNVTRDRGRWLVIAVLGVE